MHASAAVLHPRAGGRWRVVAEGRAPDQAVALAQLGLLDEYLQAGVPFDKVAIHAPNGDLVAELPSPKLDEAYPPNIGISRRALHQVLVDRARSLGVDLRQGVTIDTLEQDARSASVTFSDGRAGSFDFVVGADGIYSAMRQLLFPDAGRPIPDAEDPPSPSQGGPSCLQQSASR